MDNTCVLNILLTVHNDILIRVYYALMTISTFKYPLISARNIPSAASAAFPEDEQVMLETCGGPYFLIN
jgi:hypothetical protein